MYGRLRTICDGRAFFEETKSHSANFRFQAIDLFQVLKTDESCAIWFLRLSIFQVLHYKYSETENLITHNCQASVWTAIHRQRYGSLHWWWNLHRPDEYRYFQVLHLWRAKLWGLYSLTVFHAKSSDKWIPLPFQHWLVCLKITDLLLLLFALSCRITSWNLLFGCFLTSQHLICYDDELYYQCDTIRKDGK